MHTTRYRNLPARAYHTRTNKNQPALSCGKPPAHCARQKVVAEFQVSLVNESTLAQYDRLLGMPLDRKPLLEGLF